MAVAIINARIVLPASAGGPRQTTFRFDQRRILTLDEPPRRGDTILDLAGRAIYPGLINAHDHIEMNHYPRTRWRERYDNAHQWGVDFTPRLDEEPFRTLRQMLLHEQCWIGGQKNLQSGVTTVAQHNPLHPPLRRRDFPVRVVQNYGWAHSLYFEKNVVERYRRTPRDAPWMIHLAEGTDSVAASELEQLDRLGCLQANTVLIHGVGLSQPDQERALAIGAGLVWCPSSNFFLLGATAQVRRFAEAHLLALGTDSRLTADGDMFDELRAANATGQLSPEALFRAVTIDAAALLRLKTSGVLIPGYVADFFAVPIEADQDPFERLLALHPSDVETIYIGGNRRLSNF